MIQMIPVMKSEGGNDWLQKYFSLADKSTLPLAYFTTNIAQGLNSTVIVD